MNGCLGALRAVVGLLQTLALFGGCAGLLVGSGELIVGSIVWFLVLCVVQLAIIGIAILSGEVK